MRIKTITDKFTDLRICSGAYMQSRFDRETQTQHLTYRLNGNPIADIYDYKDSNNYRLRIWGVDRYGGRTSHNNRVDQVLRSVQMKGKSDWAFFRYSSYIRYALRVVDRNLRIEYELMKDKPMEFTYIDGRLTLDYSHYERFANTDKSATPVALETNSNLSSVESKLTNILGGL